MHPEIVIQNLRAFLAVVETDLIDLKSALKKFRVMTIVMKLPMMLLSSAVVVISSVSIAQSSISIRIAVLVINAVLAFLTSVYVFVAPDAQIDKCNSSIQHLSELSNDIQIAISELNIGGLLTSHGDSDCSSDSDAEMYSRYMLSITRFTLKKMIIAHNYPSSLFFHRSISGHYILEAEKKKPQPYENI